jgi:iron complex transport system permease protein
MTTSSPSPAPFAAWARLASLDVKAVDRVRAARRRTARRRTVVCTGISVLAVTALVCRVLLGDLTVTFVDFLRILDGAQIPGASFVVMESKLPRAVLGMLAGTAFGLSGAIFQTTLRNAMASPDVIGVSMGASACAVVAILSLGLSGAAVSGFAVVGAVGISIVIRLVAGSHGGYRIVLVGVGLAAAMSAVVSYLFTRANVYDAQEALVWMTGSLGAADWATIGQLAAVLAILLPLTWWCADSLPMTELGPDTAAGLGTSRPRTDVLLLLAVLLTAVAVAATGPIAFAGFLAGPIARALNAGRTTLLGSALTGAAIVVGADYVGAYLVADLNLPVGVVTGALGAPFLLWLMATGRVGRSVG